MPESRHKYLYERLGDHDFQLLVGALLSHRHTDYVPMPLRQADGGRDGLRRGEKRIIFQVKWSVSGSERDAFQWLVRTVETEEENIRAFAKEGVGKYFLVTNVPSTGRRERGTFDRVDKKLLELSEQFGINIACIWREEVDSMVDSAPDSIIWSYADMLAGWDLIRYLLNEQSEHSRNNNIRELLSKVAASQWADDERVKFSQVDVDREKIADLFIDVSAQRIQAVDSAQGTYRQLGVVGGTAEYLLSSPVPFTLVRGAPGQGKSTLGQYVCQANRAPFVKGLVAARGQKLSSKPRFPIRLDLSSYAAWLRGVDVFDASSDTDPKRSRVRPAATSSLECFIAELMVHASGGIEISANEVQSIFERVPSLVVLDGLDEVGSQKARKRIVAAIDSFTGRSRTNAVPPKVVVTTRPSAGMLPEPSSERFEVIALNPLDERQRGDYLRKWCSVHGIRGRDGRALRSSFKQKSGEPYIEPLPT